MRWLRKRRTDPQTIKRDFGFSHLPFPNISEVLVFNILYFRIMHLKKRAAGLGWRGWGWGGGRIIDMGGVEGCWDAIETIGSVTQSKNRAEQSRARAEQNRAVQTRAVQTRVEQNRAVQKSQR